MDPGDFAAADLWRGLDPDAPPAVVWRRPVDAPRVALLMGAFDPITNAHIAIVRGVRRTLSIATALCITKVLLARGDDQLFTPEERIPILDAVARRIDLGLAFANLGTYLDVGRALHASGCDVEFIIGSEKLVQLEDPSFYPDGARGVDATFGELRFIVIPRSDSPIERDDVVVIDPRELFADEETGTLSASRVRADVGQGRNVEDLVPPEVALALGGYTSAR